MGASQVPTTSQGLSDNWELISSVSASGSSVAFTSISGYKKLMLRGGSLSCTNNSSWTVRFNSDSGSKYDYSYELVRYGVTDKYDVNTAVATTAIDFPYSGRYNANVFLTINNTDTLGIKTITGALGVTDSSDYAYKATNLIGNYIASASISTVTLAAGTGMSGTVSLYGVRV